MKNFSLCLTILLNILLSSELILAMTQKPVMAQANTHHLTAEAAVAEAALPM